MNATAKRVAGFGLLLALALVLGLIDRAIPLSALLGGAMVPGIKLGLANTVLLWAVWRTDPLSCGVLMLLKVVLSGLLYGSLSGMLYSLSGGALSLAVMLGLHALFGRAEKHAAAAVILTSVAGAMAHNTGQVLAAAAAVHTPALLKTYLPVLLLAGAVVGVLTGIVTDRVLRAVRPVGKGGDIL